MNNIPANASDFLGPDSPLQLYLEGFRPRAGQQEMAAIIEQAIVSRESVAIEVAAGAGKTLAYLSAAMLAGNKVIISTASHQLQQQLYQRDIPLLKKALQSGKKVALLMGRNNYLCPYYLNRHQQQEPPGTAQKAKLSQIARRYSETGLGELRHYPIGEAQLKFAVTASAESCLGRACPNYQRCPWVQACQRFDEADIAVVNHSLLLTAKINSPSGEGRLFSKADTIIIDEAHRLVDFGRQAAASINSWQLKELLREAAATISSDAPEQAQLLEYTRRLEKLVSKLVIGTWPEQEQPRAVAAKVLSSLQRWWQPLSNSMQRFSQRSVDFRELAIRAGLMANSLQVLEKSGSPCWFEQRNHGFVLQSVPLTVANSLAELFSSTRASWIFTSATLTVAGSAERFLARIGQSHISFHCIESDIDYTGNALFYKPAMCLEPNASGYYEELYDRLLPVLNQVPGRSLLLFTSYHALQHFARKLAQENTLPCFAQGQYGNTELIRRFGQSDRGVLLATGSFWEGLDLADTPLTCVVIDRLPFVSPADPLVKLRSDALAGAGIDAFEQEQLVDAVIRLRQGCGRLLRRQEDRGIVIIADPRLYTREYGKYFLQSLPVMRQTDSIEDITEFFDSETVLP